ncbi:PEP-CTERM sorting domain-containing protein [Desulfobulbus sp.]|uniref:PEP-CTERM sorting domain-containing protein n=1 Tax=Desulfobulbus sp. TaxID=895 RepID=UPI00286EC601|nr:PEP-CTERM sorting domain-containing protein [Desulfobulbus sp.]
MKKQLLKSVLIAVAGIGLMAGSAMADNLYFSFQSGEAITTKAQYLNLDGNKGLETIRIQNIGVNFSQDSYLTDHGATVSFSDFTITDFSTLTLATDFYASGFTVKNSGGQTIFTADLKVTSLHQEGSMASFNPYLDVNLSNFQIGAGYTMGDSALIDAFLDYNGGAVGVAMWINNGFPVKDFRTFLKDYSGNAHYNAIGGTAAPVPEPATMLLFGAGLLGLSGVARRKIAH